MLHVGWCKLVKDGVTRGIENSTLCQASVYLWRTILPCMNHCMYAFWLQVSKDLTLCKKSGIWWQWFFFEKHSEMVPFKFDWVNYWSTFLWLQFIDDRRGLLDSCLVSSQHKQTQACSWNTELYWSVGNILISGKVNHQCKKSLQWLMNNELRTWYIGTCNVVYHQTWCTDGWYGELGQ